jgi:large subunit ribosomal protein L19
VQVVKSGHVRRSKLYYLRARSGKAARLREKRQERVAPASATATTASDE